MADSLFNGDFVLASLESSNFKFTPAEQLLDLNALAELVAFARPGDAACLESLFDAPRHPPWSECFWPVPAAPK